MIGKKERFNSKHSIIIIIEGQEMASKITSKLTKEANIALTMVRVQQDSCKSLSDAVLFLADMYEKHQALLKELKLKKCS